LVFSRKSAVIGDLESDFTFLQLLNWSCDIVIAVKGNTSTQIQDEDKFWGSKVAKISFV